MKKIYFLFIVIFFCKNIFAQANVETKQRNEGAYKPANNIAKQKNNDTRKEVEPFVNGFAKFFKNGKWGFIDSAGKIVVQNKYQAVRNFKNNIAAIQQDDKWGFVNTKGEEIILPAFDIAYDFEKDITCVYNNKKWFLINKTGNVLKQLDIDIFLGFENGIAKITKDGRDGQMNIKGEIISLGPPKTKIDLSAYHPTTSKPSSILAAPCPANIDFELNNFTNWVCYKGSVNSVGINNVISVTANVPPTSPTNTRHTIYNRITPSAIDQYGLFPTNPPDGSNRALKLGNTSVNSEAERVSYLINVPVGATDVSLTYRYAVVFQDPPVNSQGQIHEPYEKPQFTAKLYDVSLGSASSVPCATYVYIASDNLGMNGFFTSTLSPIVRYKPWTSVFVNLAAYAGKTMRLEFTTADCTQGAHWGYAYVDVGECNVTASLNYSCNPSSVSLLGPPGFQTYTWWNSNYTAVVSNNQNPTITPAPPLGTVLHVEVIPLSGNGCKDTLDVVVTNANAFVNAGADKFICKNDSVTLGNAAVAGLTYSWSPALHLSNPNIANPNASPPITTTYYLTTSGTNICPSIDTVIVTIKPDPDIIQPTNKVFCNGANTAPINFTSAIANTSYSWTNSNTTIGLAASGVGNVPSFTPVNNNSTPITATISITPTANGCVGLPKTFTITVNPIPTVTQPTSQTLCNGVSTAAINFIGSITGTTYNWANSNNTIGLAANGVGSIPSFIASNNTASPINTTITVTPNVGVCAGLPNSFIITINPTETINQPSDITFCNGSNTTPINFTGNVIGTTYSWVSSNTAIGLVANGNGDIPSFIATNNTTAQINSTITVTPSAAGVCAGTAKIFLIKVNPTANINQPADQVYCNGINTLPINFSTSIIGTTYSWVNSNTALGLAANGTGSIPSFIATNSITTPISATITVTPNAGVCAGTPKTFLIQVNPSPVVSPTTDQLVCNGSNTTAINFTSSLANTNYAWVNNNSSTGLATNGTGTIPSFIATNNTNAQITSTITVTPTVGVCAGTASTFFVKVNPTGTINQPVDQLFCNGTNTVVINFTSAVAGTTYSWANANTAIGLGTNGTGAVPSFIATNNTITQISSAVTITPTAGVCAGLPKTFLIKINPTPSVVLNTNQTLCNGTNTTAINFAGAVANTTYSWTNANTTVGLAASGIGNIPSFIATNNTATQISSTITVTPIANNCGGVATTILINVNPTATINPPIDQVYCNGTNSSAINFSGTVAGTTYSWVNSNTAVGLAANGNGNIPSFIATNITVAQISSTITVTPTAGVCAGSPKVFLIKVNPTPNAIQPAEQTLCNGANTNAINFNSTVPSTSYNWTNSNTSIGLAASGNGDITSFTAVNNTGFQTISTIAVTPTANACAGGVKTFFIKVNPTFKITNPSNVSICKGASIPITAQGAQNYQWTPAVGLSCAQCPNPIASPSFTTAYNVTAIPASNCVGNTAINITVHQPIQVLASPDKIICNLESINLLATGASSYVWSPALGLSSTTIANPMATPHVTTQYKVVGYDNNNCFTDTKFVNITVNPLPIISLGADVTLNTGTLFPLSSTISNGPITSWLWTPTTDLSCTTCPKPVATIKNEITYTAFVKNIYGCTASDNIHIYTICNADQVFVPNAFTPDGDGKNDILMVRSKGINNVVSFKIYTRWGELIFEKSNFPANNIAYGWDGKIKGKTGAAEVYVYTAEVVCDNNQNYFLKGNITILK